ncbi:glycoside hydrolase family 43 protein [Dothidotthia symphoricarpi CBS 119687]|uniref:Glycoside hydrolase family 43 protein n=1 Tax=Dothidotthia symphoricarpi CBS 119687 TaxID=1392245 RepID=A0A6A6A2A0_9PLEO|nr:glycoside hydrolase family 43 protein [Dothidotthia symphoricarpi CBS 119687]KAF2125304.1 glycoside hydrolase family 43 protein [Dothidotthia symphoricarpi CBS 119687]
MHLLPLLALAPTILAAPSQSLDFSKHGITPRAANTSLTGYLGAFFLGDAPSVYLYLSTGNNPLSLTPLNNAAAILNATLGTKGVRDPSLISNGTQTNYIIGTDLDISKTTWDASQRTGSRSIFIWQSADLATWTNERLIEVEDPSAGMVWAPSAIWDPAQSAYLVHWASKFYNTNDPQHTGTPSAIRIRYAYTTDFIAFTAPQDYIDYSPTNIIDLEFLSLGNGSYARFMKDESAKTVFMEISTTGLFGTWTRPGGPNATIHAGVEGPAPYWDNEVEGKAHLLLDFYGGDGYAPFESVDVESGVWTASDTAAWPKLLRHGSVLPVTDAQVEAVRARWG